MLTTITPYWGRPAMLRTFLRYLSQAFHPDVEHIILFVGEPLQEHDDPPRNVRFVGCQRPRDGERFSIGYYHDMGARLASTEWMMKLDLDALPHQSFFLRLLPFLKQATLRQWFNVGMFYMNRAVSETYLSGAVGGLTSDRYLKLIGDLKQNAASSYPFPAASNFVCRRDAYLMLGGCDPDFRGYGWEDYQQLYMLELYQQRRDPLPGLVTKENVTNRCRDEIGRPKSKALWLKDRHLALLHHWHPGSNDRTYKSPEVLDANRQVLLNYTAKAREHLNCILA